MRCGGVTDRDGYAQLGHEREHDVIEPCAHDHPRLVVLLGRLKVHDHHPARLTGQLGRWLHLHARAEAEGQPPALAAVPLRLALVCLLDGPLEVGLGQLILPVEQRVHQAAPTAGTGTQPARWPEHTVQEEDSNACIH